MCGYSTFVQNSFAFIEFITFILKNLQIKTLFEAYQMIYPMIRSCDVCQANVNQAIF